MAQTQTLHRSSGHAAVFPPAKSLHPYISYRGKHHPVDLHSVFPAVQLNLQVQCVSGHPPLVIPVNHGSGGGAIHLLRRSGGH